MELRKVNRVFLVGFALVVCSTLEVIQAVSSRNADLDFILSGVKKIKPTSQFGVLSLYGNDAFPILAGSVSGIRKPTFAGVRPGDGKVVCFSHNNIVAFFNENLNGYDNAQLLLNSISWTVAPSSPKQSRVGISMGSASGNTLLKKLAEHGYLGERLIASKLADRDYLDLFDVLIIDRSRDFDPDMNRYEAVKTYIREGGGLILAATPWSYNNIPVMDRFWANKFLSGSGAIYVPGYAYPISGEGYNASQEHLEDTHGSTKLWEKAKGLWQNEQALNLTFKTVQQIIGVLRDRELFGPLNITWESDLQNELATLSTHPVPTVENPVQDASEMNLLQVHRLLSYMVLHSKMFNGMPEHAAAKHFPGLAKSMGPKSTTVVEIIPFVCSACYQAIDRPSNLMASPIYSDISDEIQIDVNNTYTGWHWHSTGLYAPPGELILVNVMFPFEIINNYAVQIGSQTDNSVGHPSNNFVRCPRIVYTQEIVNNNATIASAFGGLIYINVPKNATSTIKVSITGNIIKSPTYFRGQTQLQNWRREIRYNPAPWGELVGNNLVITVSSKILVTIDNPEQLIELWDLVLDFMADLSSNPRKRARPERIISDVQLRGWMHSGYPIVTHMSVEKNTVSLQKFHEESHVLWGQLHELGHNHQRSDWNFGGSGEVTCNMFAVYIMHSILGVPTNESHGNLSNAVVKRKVQNYILNGLNFSDWKQNSFLALQTYIQLQEEFGWGAYKTVFASYHVLSEDEKPQNDQDKIDLWMIQFSRAVGENLTKFFRSWGIHITAEAEAKVSDLLDTELRILDPNTIPDA